MNLGKYVLSFIGLVSILIGCSSEETNRLSDEMNSSKTEDLNDPSPIEEELYFPIFDEIGNTLTGIEKYYVQNNPDNLLSLLEYKQDERAEIVKEKIELMSSLNDTDNIDLIKLIDNRNGYMVYNSGAQVDVEMTYWNMSGGNKLIAKSNMIRTNNSEEISFEVYDSERGGEYQSAQKEKLIPQFDKIQTMIRLMDPSLGADGGCIFKLPRNGTNITFCADENCVDLIWKDGTFKIED